MRNMNNAQQHSPNTRPHSRTTFPAGVDTTHSSLVSETLGAYGEVNLSRPSSRVPTPSKLNGYPQPDYPAGSVVLQLPLLKTEQYQKNPSRQSSRQSSQNFIPPVKVDRPQQLPQYGNNNNQFDFSRMNDRVYLPTTAAPPSHAGSAATREYDKFREVYSTSGDTVEFARNFGGYVSQRIPVPIWIGLMMVFILVGFIILLIGSFNIPFCNVQPMIPIYLMVFGILIIVSSIIRIYAVIPTPRRRSQQRQSMSSNMCLSAIELLFLLANIIWLILGCVWVYGSKPYVHFEEHMFEEHYCERGLYWAAFSVCTGSLLTIVFGIIVFLFIMVVGAYKESEREMELD